MPKTEYQLRIISKIKELRISNNVSQIQIADILNLSSSGAIGNIESSKFSNKYTLEQIKILTDYFNFPFPKIFLSDEEFNLNKEEFTEILISNIIKYAR